MPPPGGTRTQLTFSYSALPNWGTFSPGVPMVPVAPQPARVFDFPVNVNSNIRPRAYEPFGFPQLRAFSNVELIRMAIETRKDQIERLNWQIKPVDDAKPSDSDKAKIAELTKFWRKPDGATPFSSFMRLLIEDLLSIDAPAMEMRRTRGGTLIGLEPIDGTTIHPMIDETGRRPRDPTAVAYQQVIKGVAWANLTNRDVLYVPRNVRPGHLYGYAPTEQLIVTINTIIRRQALQLAHFTESNVPAGLLNAPDGWDMTKIAEIQTWFDDKIRGNQAEQAKLVWGPSGTKYQAFKDSPIKDEFDEWLARMVAFAFSLPPTPFIRQMNKGTAGADQDRAEEEGLEPLKLWAKRWIDGVIQDDQGAPGLEFAWVETPSIDPKLQAEIDDRNVRNGTSTIDEVRDGRGDDPLPDGLGAKPMIYTSSGAMTLEQVMKTAENAINGTGMVEPPLPQHAGAPSPGAPPPPGAPPKNAPPPAKQPASSAKLAKAASLSPERPKARRAAASAAKAIAKVLTKAGDDVAAQVAKALQQIGKAEADPKKTSEDAAAAIAEGLDLSSLDPIEGALHDDLLDIAFDSANQAMASVGVKTSNELTNRVYDRAVDYARERAAELVSVDGEESLIASTRETIRSTIADGLEQNLGADAIADNIQESQAFSETRASLIARTEIAKANGEGKGEGWKEAQSTGLVIMKSWTVSNDDNTCDECFGNEDDGEIPLDDAFSSGDDFEPAHPGCQCAVVAQATQPDDGNADEDS